MEVVATGGQTFLLFCPQEDLAVFTFGFLLCSSTFWLSWGRVFYLPFPVHELSGYCCSPSAAALWVFCCFTKPPSKPSKGWSSPILSHLPLPCTGAFPGGISQDPMTPVPRSPMHLSPQSNVAIGTGSAKALPSLGLLWAWDNPVFALEGPLFSEQRSDVRLVFRSC